MPETFVDLVSQMRQAQKDYYDLATSKEAPFKRQELSRLLQRAKGLESKVDQWLKEYKDKARQLVLLDLRKQTDEMPGQYNLPDETQTNEGGAG